MFVDLLYSKSHMNFKKNTKKKKKQRVWDKTKKNFVWQKDQEDKMSK